MPIRPIAPLALTLLLLAGCGGGGAQPPATQTSGLGQQGFTIADLPEVSTNPIGSNQVANLQIDQAAQAALKKYNLPGATVVVLKDQQVVYAKGYGYSNLATRTPARPEDRFQIGSISKMFVAAAILLLAEDGKLALDDTVGKYFGGLPDSWRPITIRQLLSHSSGVASDGPGDAIAPAIMNRFDSFMAGTDAERVAAIAALPLHSVPGSQFEYSNMAYSVAGMLASKVAGMHYTELLQQRVFRPLGMSTARKLDVANPKTDTALGYRLDGAAMKEYLLTPHHYGWPALGAGGIEMSVLDMAKWDSALYGSQVLKPSSVAEMAKPHITVSEGSSYGLGWYLFTVNGHFLAKHAGSMGGFVADYRRFPDDRFSTIVLTNNGDTSLDVPGALAIARSITDLLQPQLSVR